MRVRFTIAAVACALVSVVFAHRAAAQSVRTPHDHIPDFAAKVTVTSAAAGAWSNPSTWQPAQVPTPRDVVRIRHEVAYDSTEGDADVIAIDAGGRLSFSRTASTVLRVGTLLVRAKGALDVGTPSSPIPAGVTAEVVIKDQALNASADPDQFGTGLLVLNGSISFHGSTKSPTWVRLAAEPRAGDATLTLAEAVSGWAVGDLLVIPDSREDPTRQNDAQLERRTIAKLSADGRTIGLSAALTHDHPGARDLKGAVVFLPHVMNLSRNVVIRSENPAGTRGHTMYTARSTVDVRYAQYRDLGRTTIEPLNDKTNHIGRYALHLHHLAGPTPASSEYQFTVVGNAVVDTNTARSKIKWPIAVHDSHYGLVQWNTVYNAGGAAIVTEDGSESENLIEKNMVVRVLGEGDRRGVKSNGALEGGSQGSGFWFRGPNNYIRHNVAANSVETSVEAGYGFEVFQEYLGNVRIPKFKGADTSVSGQYTLRSGYEIPLLDFSGNEAYGQPQGLTYWWVGMENDKPHATAENVFRDLTLWHISRYPIYGYPGHKVVFDGLKVYGDVNVPNECCNIIWYGDYQNVDAVIRRSTIIGIESVVLPYFGGGTTRVEDSLIAAQNGIVNLTSGAPGTCPGCRLPDRTQIISNVTYGALPGRPLRTITMSFFEHNGSADLKSKDELYVTSYRGQPGNDFRVYYTQQGTKDVAGERAPCADTRPEIAGITCPGTPPSSTTKVPKP